ncbi:MAG: glutathione S-transferase family protein [Gammaproteobacteria bacterium]|nr:glutathione S-transferase family protein [Gammaproteobacteria bacterium]NNL49814.1 glutathione S-transferase family protein [Woeseiaceae bacterium]
MTDYVLYQYPLRACSSVTVNAMMEVGLEFEDQVINILAGEQNEAAYRKIHPFGKVPALSVDGDVIIENVAILLYIDAVKPGVLFPQADCSLDRAEIYSDLVWCAATLHPAVRRVRMPMRYTDGDTVGVREKGLEELTKILNVIEERLSGDRWWYNDRWSIIDVYVNWGIMTAASTDLISLPSYPAIRSHIQRVRARPSFRAALARQTAAKERAGLVFPDEATWNTEVS